MAKEYKVSQAFQATVSKEDKTPKTVELNGHIFNVWKVKLDGEGDKGWINVNKKQGNDIKPGDELYGDVTAIDGKYGKFYGFKSASKPMESTQYHQSGDSQVRDDVIMRKLDLIIQLLGGDNATAMQVETVIPGAEPVDLNSLEI